MQKPEERAREKIVVIEHDHERAVADQVNVNYDVYKIETEITKTGSRVEKGFLSIDATISPAKSAGNSSTKTWLINLTSSTVLLSRHDVR